MKGFVEKLLNELNYQKEYNQIVYDAKPRTEHEKDLNAVLQSTYDSAIRIVKRLAGEYERENLIGWIPCEKELPPQPKENPVFDNKPLELYLVSNGYSDYPFRAFWNGKFFVDGFSSVDVIAWQPLPDPYIPKEEEQKGITI